MCCNFQLEIVTSQNFLQPFRYQIASIKFKKSLFLNYWQLKLFLICQKNLGLVSSYLDVTLNYKPNTINVIVSILVLATLATPFDLYLGKCK